MKYDLLLKVFNVVVLMSVLLFVWGVGGYLVMYNAVLSECINDFGATGAILVPFNGTYCTVVMNGSSMIAPLSLLRERMEKRNAPTNSGG